MKIFDWFASSCGPIKKLIVNAARLPLAALQTVQVLAGVVCQIFPRLWEWGPELSFLVVIYWWWNSDIHTVVDRTYRGIKLLRKYVRFRNPTSYFGEKMSQRSTHPHTAVSHWMFSQMSIQGCWWIKCNVSNTRGCRCNGRYDDMDIVLPNGKNTVIIMCTKVSELIYHKSVDFINFEVYGLT